MHANPNISGEVVTEKGVRLVNEAPLILAAGFGSLDIVNLLLNSGANPDVQEIILAAPGGNEPAIRGNTPLLVSAKPEVTAALLHARADPNLIRGDGLSPLETMAEQGRYLDCKLLLHAGADKKARFQGLRPAESAAKLGHADIASLIDNWR